MKLLLLLQDENGPDLKHTCLCETV